MDFQSHKQQIQSNFDAISSKELFQADIDRDVIWELYWLTYWNQAQEYNCNCCKSFVRQAGGVVTSDGQTVWGSGPVHDYVVACGIRTVYYHPDNQVGYNTNYSEKHSCNFDHLNLLVGRTRQVHHRDQVNALNRAFVEIKPEALVEILQLIDEGQIYRGEEHRKKVAGFQALQQEFDGNINYCWENHDHPLTLFRNSVIGTLAVDISNGLDVDEAVRAFENKMYNYKRPTALVTEAMRQRAKEKVAELGLTLVRRHAFADDLNINNLIFIDKTAKSLDPFDQIDVVVNDPKPFREMSIEEFINQPMPSQLEVIVENRHEGNFMSLLTGNDTNLLMWDNTFSWAYTGGTTDSIKQRVKDAGGKIDAKLRVSLSWFNYDDLDIHCIEPDGNRICYNNKCGKLDVDMNVSPTTRSAVENIAWQRPKYGKYQVKVHNYTRRENQDTGYEIELECDGVTYNYTSQTSPNDKAFHDAFDFENCQERGLIYNGKSKVMSKTKWGIKTHTYVKVKKIMLSPNHWGNPTGNKHYFFILEDCKADEQLRGFFNEYLNPELHDHRKTLEMVGSRVIVERSDEQLSGIGFSSTQRNHLLLKQDNQLIKVNF